MISSRARTPRCIRPSGTAATARWPQSPRALGTVSAAAHGIACRPIMSGRIIIPAIAAGGASTKPRLRGRVKAADPENLTWLVPAEGTRHERHSPRPPLTTKEDTPMQRTQFTGETVTQMHHARQMRVTPEMVRVAEREGVEPEFIRAEVARGRMVIPANVNHKSLDPMAIGIHARCKINANIGNSAIDSNV